MFRRELASLIALLILATSACAIDAKEIPAANADAAKQWVNWFPLGWESREETATLAKALMTSAGSREEYPKAVHHWVCENICYDYDALRGEVYSTLSPEEVLWERRGVCEGISNLVQALFLEAGIPCIKTWGVAISEKEHWTTADLSRINHTWNEFYQNGRWITMDCTMDNHCRYENKTYHFSPCTEDYVDPDESFFSKTHLRLQRGLQNPEDQPSQWALKTVSAAVNRGTYPLFLFSDYCAPISRQEFSLLLNSEYTEENILLTRGEAAILIAGMHSGEEREESVFFEDLTGCDEGMISAIGTLFTHGIMLGNGSRFYPHRLLTRQEAIVIVERFMERSAS